jgi:two-component system NtrC family sensor kinase
VNGQREDEGPESDDEWESRDSGPVPLPPARRRSRVGQVTTGTQNRTLIGEGIRAAREPSALTLHDVAHECAQLVRQASSPGPIDEEALLELYLARMGAVLSGRRLVVRLARESGPVDLVRSTAPLAPERREQQRITSEALSVAGLDPDDAALAGFGVIDDYRWDFDEGSEGFDVALVDGGRLLGVMGVEYHPGVRAPEPDRPILRIFAAQLSVALGRARIGEEASYLSGYLASLLHDANVPLLVLDRKRRIQVVSRAFLELTGKRRSEVLHRDLVELVPERSQQCLMQAVLQSLREGELSAVDVQLPTAGSEPREVMLDLVSILGPEEEVEALLVIARDLTALRRLEEQVVHAEKLATLGQLAAGVVHELNNPLTSISVYAERLHQKASADPSADPTDVERLGRIVQAAERILRFTGDLVTYARPATEPPKALSPAEVVEQALVFCEHVVRDTQAEVDLAIDAELPRVLGVRGQLHQVFINLFTNACQAMPDGAGRLTIRGELTDKRAVAIHVSDNGAGIPVDQRDSIFEPFFSTKGEGEGTGLGLSIVRNIVQQHGGAIEVMSEIGQGTTFTVVLPSAD